LSSPFDREKKRLALWKVTKKKKTKVYVAINSESGSFCDVWEFSLVVQKLKEFLLDVNVMHLLIFSLISWLFIIP